MIRNQSNYSGSQHDNIAYWLNYYSDKLKFLDVDRERNYAKFLESKLGQNQKIADVGMGLGFFAKESASLGMKVYGIDLSFTMLNRSQDYIDGSQNIFLINSDAIKMPLQNESMDAIVTLSLIEHFTLGEIKNAILPEFNRVTRRKGYLFVHVPVKTSKTQFIRFWRKYIINDLPEWSIDDNEDRTHRIWLTFENYRNVIECFGYRLEAYDFQLRHSKASDLVKLIERYTTKTLEQFSKDDFFSSKELLGDRLVFSVISEIATSCQFLFRKL